MERFSLREMTSPNLRKAISAAPKLNPMHTTNMAVHMAEAAKHELCRRSKMKPFERSVLELTLGGYLESRYRRLEKGEGTMYCYSSLGGDGPEWCRRIVKPGERIANFYEDYSDWSEEERQTGEGGSQGMVPNCLDCEIRDIANQFKEDYGWLIGVNSGEYNKYVREMVAVIAGYVSVDVMLQGIAEGETGFSNDELVDVSIQLIRLRQLEEALEHHYPNSPKCFEDRRVEDEEKDVGDAIYWEIRGRKEKILEPLLKAWADWSGYDETGELRVLRAYLSGSKASMDAVQIIDDILNGEVK